MGFNRNLKFYEWTLTVKLRPLRHEGKHTEVVSTCQQERPTDRVTYSPSPLFYTILSRNSCFLPTYYNTLECFYLLYSYWECFIVVPPPEKKRFNEARSEVVSISSCSLKKKLFPTDLFTYKEQYEVLKHQNKVL